MEPTHVYVAAPFYGNFSRREFKKGEVFKIEEMRDLGTCKVKLPGGEEVFLNVSDCGSVRFLDPFLESLKNILEE